MRQFQISAAAFEGFVKITYKTDGLLCSIDLSNAKMTRITTAGMKRFVPEHVDDLATAFATTKATVIECDFDVTFDMFWIAYDKKINRKRCEPLWHKLTKTKQVKAWAGISEYEKYLKNLDWKRPKADPDTYLRNEYWENEWK